MAALSDPWTPEVVELKHVTPEDLNPVLDEETRVWDQTLDWDFRPSVELVRRFVGMQALSGYSLWIGGEAAGYSYFVTEERKGLIGDLYIRERFATEANEWCLLGAVLDTLRRTPGVRRVESQLMMLRHGPRRGLVSSSFPDERFLHIYERDFLVLDLALAPGLAPGHARAIIEPWSERRQEEATHMIAAAYHGHIDSEINDQYRSPSGARRFLMNIIQYPGCGSFFQPASFLALDPVTGALAGISLASLVSAGCGHITQICVAPPARGTGVGYELLRRSLVALADHGCRHTSLTVTSANRDAIRLYESVGFRAARHFAAHVWEGWAR